MLVHVLDSSEELHGITEHFELSESLSSSDQLIQGLVGAELKNDVHIFMVFKEVFEADDIGVAERAMDFNFAHELEWDPSYLLLGPWLLERSLTDDLDRIQHFGLEIGNFVTFGEPSLEIMSRLTFPRYRPLRYCL